MAESLESQCESNQVSGRQERNCKPCKKKNKDTVAGLFCRTCGQYQCEECCSVHGLFEYMSSHDIVSADDAKTTKPAFDMQGLDKCKDHYKSFEVFCADHDALCCSTCVLVSHRTCSNVNEISSIASKKTLKASVVLSEIQKLQEKANRIIKVLATRPPTPDEPQSLLEYIEELKLMLINKYDQLKMLVADKFKEAKCVQMSLLNKNLLTTKAVLSDLQRKQDILTSANLCGSVQQNFVLCHLIKAQISPYQTTLETQQTTSYQIDYLFDCKNEVLQILNSDVNLATFNIKKEPIDFSTSKVEKPIKLKPVTCVTLTQGRDDIDTPLYTGMDFFPDGRLVVIDRYKNKIYVVSKSLDILELCKLGHLPLSVAAISCKEVAVTCEPCVIAFLHVSKTNTLTLTRTMNTTAQYDSISLMDETTFLVSTVSHQYPIRMITMTGVEKDFNNLTSNRYWYGNGASKSTYLPDQHIAVFYKLGDVFMHDTKKSFTRRFENIRKKASQTGLCAGPDDCFLLCGRNAVLQASTSGNVISLINLDMKEPHVICVSKDGKRLVVTNNAKSHQKLQLFHIL